MLERKDQTFRSITIG